MSLDDLDSLYDAHAQALFGFLLNLTRSEADTHDLLQDLFCKLAANPSLLDKIREPRAYLLRLAHNRAIDLARRRQTREKVNVEVQVQTEGLFALAPVADEETFRRELALAMEELPSDQRAVVHLKIWENRSFAQISEILNIPLNTAASRYRYGLDKLRARLRPLYNEIQ